MLCSVCSSAPSVSAGLCSGCSSLMVKVEAVPHVPDLFGGTSRAKMRDRQWLFKHAREAIANADSTREDLISIRDRLPHSKRGTSLRNQINKRLKDDAVGTLGDLFPSE